MVCRADEAVNPADLARMCQTLIHRGPDDEGAYIQGPVGLGMRRLSVIDLNSGHQPIHNEDHTVWVVLNGEIYNYRELRKDLQGRGHSFYTGTDTEVIVHLYEEVGSKCPEKLRGMFAIALYDERRQTLLLARDRLGKKPLHYALQDGRLWFGSEIKALLAVAPKLAEPDPAALLQYFSFGYIPDPRTAFAPIRKLPPGHRLEYRNREAMIGQYWDLPAYGTHQPSSEESALEQLETLLTDAVRLRLVSDVPLGALLSGGVDSSLVVALMAQSGSARVKTFSVGFKDRAFDETAHARSVAEQFQTEHHELIVEPNIDETLQMLTRTLEEPFGDSSMVPTFHICRMARQHVTVALSGDGGDELFAGYDRYAVHMDREKFGQLPAWAGRQFRERMYPHLPSAMKGRRLAYNLSFSPSDRYLDSITHLSIDRDRMLFSDELRAWAQNGMNPTEPFRIYFNQAPAQDDLGRIMYLDSKTYLPADILTKVDRMSMLNSLEVRCPLLDHVFVEWAAGLPSSWKLRLKQPKYLLKKLAGRLGVPKQVLHRPKQGFAMPLAQWWRKDLAPGLLDLLTEPRTLQRGYFNPASVRELVHQHRSSQRDRSYDLWILLVFELWHRNFLEPGGWAATSASFPPASTTGTPAWKS
jgi:asparagine synthase (glutamine-hydrolysing)